MDNAILTSLRLSVEVSPPNRQRRRKVLKRVKESLHDGMGNIKYSVESQVSSKQVEWRHRQDHRHLLYCRVS